MMRSTSLSLCLLAACTTTVTAELPWQNSHETPASRAYFYIGGAYDQAITDSGSPGLLYNNALYVERLEPVTAGGDATNGTLPPVILTAGGAVTGAQYLNKPDGNPGWASYFLSHGRTVYIVDMYSSGRSADTNLPGPLIGTLPATAVQDGFTAPEKAANQSYYQARFHTQWPGNGSVGDPDFNAFYATFRPLITNFTNIELASRTALCQLLQYTGKAFVVSHSVGSSGVWAASDACPQLFAGHIGVELDTVPFPDDNGATSTHNVTLVEQEQPIRPYGVTFTPVVYDPPISNYTDLSLLVNGTAQFTANLISQVPCVIQNPAAQVHRLANLSQVPLLLLFSQASVVSIWQQCFAAYLVQAGVPVKSVPLATVNITGNGHFPMNEKNSDDIAAYMAGWMSNVSTNGA